MSVLWNNSTLPTFVPKRGLKQGDPLSSYVLVLCMENLSNLILEKVEKKEWVGIKASKFGRSFSHLFFANDFVLFSKAGGFHCNLIKDVLSVFVIF